jgi:nitrogen fixation NifU-like protein
MEYSKKVQDHFQNPRNVGEIKNADGIGKVGNPKCGDIIWVYIKVEKNKIKDIKFKTFGCAGAISTASVMTEIVKGKSLEFAKKLTNQDVAKDLGLPESKIHCSNLSADALHAAIKDYEKRPQKL